MACTDARARTAPRTARFAPRMLASVGSVVSVAQTPQRGRRLLSLALPTPSQCSAAHSRRRRGGSALLLQRQASAAGGCFERASRCKLAAARSSCHPRWRGAFHGVLFGSRRRRRAGGVARPSTPLCGASLTTPVGRARRRAHAAEMPAGSRHPRRLPVSRAALGATSTVRHLSAPTPTATAGRAPGVCAARSRTRCTRGRWTPRRRAAVAHGRAEPHAAARAARAGARARHRRDGDACQSARAIWRRARRRPPGSDPAHQPPAAQRPRGGGGGQGRRCCTRARAPSGARASSRSTARPAPRSCASRRCSARGRLG